VRVRELVVRGQVVRDQWSCGEQEETSIAKRYEVAINLPPTKYKAQFTDP
jgi:hypothetical protein